LKGVLDLNVSGVLLVTLAVFVRRGVRDEIGATALLRRDAVLVCMGNKVRVLVRLYKVPEGDGEVAPVWVRTGEGVLDVNLMGKALLDNKVCVRVRMVVEAVQRRVLVREKMLATVTDAEDVIRTVVLGRETDEVGDLTGVLCLVKEGVRPLVLLFALVVVSALVPVLNGELVLVLALPALLVGAILEVALARLLMVYVGVLLRMDRL